MLRLITAGVLGPLLWVLIKRAPAWAFIAACMLVIFLASHECYRMLSRWRPFTWVGVAGCLALAWSFSGMPPSVETRLSLVAVTLITVILAMFRRDSPRSIMDSAMNTLFPVLLIGLTLAHVVGLRGAPGTDGEDLVLLLFLCVIFSDTAAYYVGSTFGKHRMAPQLSPKKSWEGAVGGLGGSVIAALLAHFWFYQRLPLEHAMILGVVLGAAGILGDLAESVVKRAAGAKDSSNLLPGHGGMLDRMDSLLFAGPILYYYYFHLLGTP